MKPKMICIGMPNMGSIKTETVYSTTVAMFYAGNKLHCGFHLFFPVSSVLTESRERCAQEALDIGASHLMFVDSDMAFPEHGIVTLASRDKKIIGANYNIKSIVDHYCTVKFADEKGKYIQVGPEQIPREPFKCGAVATGFMLIETDVFRRIPKPWFLFEYNYEEGYTIGEDVYFCRKAQEYGFEVWCDPTIPIKHIGDYPY